VHTVIDCRVHSILQAAAARTDQLIEFTFGNPYLVQLRSAAACEKAHNVAIVGAQTHRRVDLTLQGRVESFVILFQPGGLSRLFSIPADLLTDGHFEGRSVLGKSVDELRSQLGESRSFSERIRIVERYLLKQARTDWTRRSFIDVAKALTASRGPVRIAAMASSTGLGIRQFERKFTSEMGLSPRQYACIARFEAALEFKRRSPDLRWIQIAHEFGYHDQAHLVHDFQRLAGSSPVDTASRTALFSVIDDGHPNPFAQDG
jgi:AraC-like DNA-binding protein